MEAEESITIQSAMSAVIEPIVIVFSSELSEASAISRMSESVGFAFAVMSVGNILLTINRGLKGYVQEVVRTFVSVIHIIRSPDCCTTLFPLMSVMPKVKRFLFHVVVGFVLVIVFY